MTNEMLQEKDTQPAHLLVAMEMSLTTWRLAMSVEGQVRKRVKTIEAGNYVTLLEAVAEAKMRCKLPKDTGMVLCYEAGRDGSYPYRRLMTVGHEVWGIDSASIEVSRRRKRAKSDGIDADKLSDLMQRREILRKDLQRLRNQMESVLFTRGYREVPNTTRELKAWLEARREVGAQLRQRLTREVARLALLEQQCQAVEKELARHVRQEQTSDIAVVARALMQLCGIGLIGAWVLASECSVGGSFATGGKWVRRWV